MAFRPATCPTMLFVGVTTGRSSIMTVFPRWAAALGMRDCALRGIDLPPRAPAADVRAVVQFIKDDPLTLGALVTTHKLDVFAAARDLFDGLNPDAEALGEVSCLSKRDGRLFGHALDTDASALALAALVPAGHWRAGGTCFAVGAGGAALAISVCLAKAAERPVRLIVSDRDPGRLDHFGAIWRRLGLDLPVQFVAASDNAAVLAELPPHSLVINATGLGKDAPGSPLPDGAAFPAHAVAWDLNYRGNLLFLDQARAAGARAEDGWVYFLHGWTRTLATVFDIDIPTSGPAFEALSRIAAETR